MGSDEILGRIHDAQMLKALKDQSVRARAQADQTLASVVGNVMGADDPARVMVTLAGAVGEVCSSGDEREHALGALASIGLARVHESLVAKLGEDDADGSE